MVLSTLCTTHLHATVTCAGNRILYRILYRLCSMRHCLNVLYRILYRILYRLCSMVPPVQYDTAQAVHDAV